MNWIRLKITRSSNPRRWWGFAIVQLLLLSTAVAATVHRERESDELHRLPELLPVPRKVLPTYDYPQVVSDEQLHHVLWKLRPKLRVAQPKINHVDHALRFWGVAAVFDDPECLSGAEIRDLLLDHARFSQAWGEGGRPLLMSDSQGVAVRTQEGNATASHVDHTLAGLAELGTPLDYPVRTIDGTATVRSMLDASLSRFRLNQAEYEWSALAYALYLAPTSGWFTAEGQRIDFDRIADRIMRQPLADGVCRGNHRLHALVVLLRVDQQHPTLSRECRERVVAHLKNATARLVRHQHARGYWDAKWSERPAADAASHSKSLTERLLATGHAMEWWALAPPSVHPPRSVLVRAGQWLCRTIEELDANQVQSNYTYLTHAGHALALWRGQSPAEFLGRDPRTP